MRRFVFALVLLAACAPQPARVIVTAPKKHLAVGEKMVLSAKLADKDTTTQEFYWWRTGGENFELRDSVLTAKKPGDALVCATHWYSYIRLTDGTKPMIRNGTESEHGCTWITSSPAK